MHAARVYGCIVVCSELSITFLCNNSQLSILQAMTALLQQAHYVTGWEDALVKGDVTPCSCELRRSAPCSDCVNVSPPKQAKNGARATNGNLSTRPLFTHQACPGLCYSEFYILVWSEGFQHVQDLNISDSAGLFCLLRPSAPALWCLQVITGAGGLLPRFQSWVPYACSCCARRGRRDGISVPGALVALGAG